MWKRNLLLLILLHIGAFLFPFLTVSKEKLTPERIAVALALLAVVLMSEALSIYLIFKRRGLRLREGLIWILELKEIEYAKLSEEERDLAVKFGYIIIGFPAAGLILCGAVLEWGDLTVAFKFPLIFFAFIVPLLQLCLFPLVVLFYTYNRFLKNDLAASANFSVFWAKLSIAGLVLVLLSLMLVKSEVLPFVKTITAHRTAFILAPLFNIFVGALQYLMAKTGSRELMVTFSAVLFASPLLSFALLLELLGAYSLQESLKFALIGVSVIFLAMFAATWVVLRLFGYSFDTLQRAVEEARVEGKSPIRNVLFWLFWVNAAIVGIGIFFVIRILTF